MDSAAGAVAAAASSPGSAGAAGPEAVHQKLEETSASLAAALQAVEEKIKEEGQKE